VLYSSTGTGGVTGCSADRQQIFLSMFYSFTVSAGISCDIGRNLEKRKDAVCVGAVVAKQASIGHCGEPTPARLYVLQTGDESAHGFGSRAYCVSFWDFE